MKKVSLLILVSLVLIVLASCQVLPQPVKDALGIHEHEWTDATCESPKTCECGETEGEALGHTWTEATCTAPKTCSVCQATEGEALGHDWVKATCEAPKTCKNCGKTDGKALGHSWLDATCTDPKTCEDCGAIEGNALGHTPAAAVRENEVAPGCETDGKYDSVIYCSACKAEISREKDVVDPATGHKAGTPVKQNEKAPTCTEAGSYDEVTYCTVEGCGAEVSRVTKTVEATGHKPGEAVHENGTEPDCINGGAYDSVTYCTVCNVEVSRTPVTTGPLGHKMAPATCITLSTCTVCGHTEGEYADHTPAAEVKENEVAPKCEQTGSYDIVVYCSVEGCGHEISRETKTVDATGHNMVEATCQAPKHCANNCGLEEGEKTNHKLVATYGANVSYACPMCETTYTMTAGTLSDGTQHNAMSFGDNGVKGYGDDKAAIVDGHYELLLKQTVAYLSKEDGGDDTSNAIGQHQIWVPAASGTGLAGLTSDNNAIGVLSFDMNVKGDNPDMPFRVQLVDYSSDAKRWSEEWCISDYVFKLEPITSAEQTTVNVYGWGTKKIGTLTLAEDQWTGWVNVAMVIIPRGDDLTIHYYINNEYWESITLPLTTKTKGINSVYFTGSTITKDTGFKYDNIAFGCVQNAEWTLDVHTHTWIDADCEHAKYCYICGVTEGDPLGHTEATKDENFVNPDCVNTGSHEHVTYCSVCNKELKRETVTDAALGHIEQTVTGTPATCLEGGMTDGKICTREGCKTPTLEAQKPIPATGHKDENADKICDVCSADLNCKHEGERTPVDAVPPTCTATGLTAGEKCAICGEFTVPQTEVAAAGHKPGEEHRENAVAPTCTEDGKYDSVYYCTVCSEMTSETKDVVDPKLGHAEVAHAGQAATCTDKGWKDYVTCSRCNYNTYEEIAALGHTWSGAATCVAGQTCSVCGAAGSAPDANNHKYVKGTEGANITYTCSACEHKVVVETYYEFTGANANDFTLSKNGNISTKVEDGVYVITNDDDTQNNAGNGGNQYMAFLPKKAADPKMNGFSCASDAYGVVSFRISTNATKDLSVSLCTPRDDAANWVGWGKSDIKILSIKQAADGKRAVMGGLDASKHFFDVTIGENNWSEWVDVQIFIDLDPNGDITLIYFVDGTYYGTWTRNMINPEGKPYISSLDTRCLYFDGWTNGKGTGFKLDDVTFGYTAHNHDMTPEIKNGEVVYACDCGTTFKLADEYREWNGDGSDSTSLGNHPNGNVTMEVVNGQYEVMFKPATTTAPTFDATNNIGYESQDGWCEYDKKGWAGGQIQLWAPYAYGNGQFGEFSCENNSVGMISFKMKTNMTRHADQDTSLTFSIGKTRSPESHWTGWDNSSINIFTVEDYLESGVVLKGGLDGTNLNFGTVGVADGWSEWFEVMIVIEMSDNGYIYVYYYINGAFCGSDSRDLNNPPAGKRTLDPKEIETLQISGWTYKANTGIVFDDLYFGHTKNGHNTLDGQSHIIPADATCAAHATCSCGWTGQLVEHDLTPATCTAPATCKACGMTVGEALPHSNITCSYVDGKAVYGCAGCDNKFTVETGFYADGSENDYDGMTGSSGNTAFNTNNHNPVINGGYYEYTKKTEGDGAKQLQLWLPVDGSNKLNDFNADNNAVGVLSFSVNAYITNKMSSMQFVSAVTGDFADKNGDGVLMDWAWIQAHPTEGDFDGNGSITWDDRAKSPDYIRWSADWCISDHFFKIHAINSDNTVKVEGWGAGAGQWLTLKTVQTSDWTGWFDVAIVISFDAEADIIICEYYIDGKYIGTGHRPLTTNNNGINSIYWNTNTEALGSGYKFDNLAFGYTAGGHNIFDGAAHYYTKAAENCGEKSTCVCGWEGYTIDHTYDSACAPACSACGAANANAAVHANLTPAVNGETVTYTCSACNYAYTLDGGMHDGADILDATAKVKVDGVDTITYTKTTENGYLEYTNIHSAAAQWQFWVPGQTESPELKDFTNANNATGFLSFRVNVKNTDSRGTEFKVNANRGTNDWGGPSNNGWSESSVRIIHFAPIADGKITINGYNGNGVGSIAATGENGWTGWIDVVIKIQLNTNNTVSINYYINGQLLKTINADMVIWTNEINSLYASAYTNPGEGVMVDDFYFGYTLNGMTKVEAPAEPEDPLYNADGSLKVEEIGTRNSTTDNTANVTEAALLTIVDGKIKQFDQTDKAAEGNNQYGYFVKEVGTSHYVKVWKDDKYVEAIYLSRSVDWDTYASVSTQNEFKSEFRFAIDNTKRVTSISFDYLLNGTLTPNRTVKNGVQLNQLSIFQIKYTNKADNTYNPNDQYFDVVTDKADDDVTFIETDGQWHTFTYTFENSVQLDNFLIILSEFQGEFVLANLVVTYEAAPLYNEVIAAENVTNAALTTILANKIKQVDQVNADSTRSEADATAAGDWYSSTNGTAVYVTTNVNGKDTEGVYFSRSKDWFNVAREKEEYGFSSFRFALNANVKSITFSYRIDGTLEDCTYLGFNDKISLLNDGNFTLTGNAYLEIVSGGTYYVVDHGTTFETDGQWHTMTIDLGEGMEMTNFLFSLYHFKGEMVVADLNVVYA